MEKTDGKIKNFVDIKVFFYYTILKSNYFKNKKNKGGIMNSVILMYKIEEGLKKKFPIKLQQKRNKLDRVYCIEQVLNTRNIITETISKVLEENDIGIFNQKSWICITLEDGRIIYATPILECLRPVLKLAIENQ